MKTVTNNNLEQNLKEATSTLIEMAKKSCWNKISVNTSYIISEIVNDNKDLFYSRIERKKANDIKSPKTLKQITFDLKAVYDNLYDLNLYIYKSEKDKTIIEIQYYLKSSLKSEFYEAVKDNEPMLHVKIKIPPYVNNTEEKYDVNWELGGIKYELNLLFSRLKLKWKYKKKTKNVG